MYTEELTVNLRKSWTDSTGSVSSSHYKGAYRWKLALWERNAE